MVTQVTATDPTTAKRSWWSSANGRPTCWVVGIKLDNPDEWEIKEGLFNKKANLCYISVIFSSHLPSPSVWACTKLLHCPGTLENALTLNWYNVLPLRDVTSFVVLLPLSVSTQGCKLPWATDWYSMLYFTMPPLGSSGGCQWSLTALMDRTSAWMFRGEEGPGERSYKILPFQFHFTL